MRNSKFLFLVILCSNMFQIKGNNNNNTTCGCYQLGTITSIEGQSMCDNKTLQCKCFPNVVGKNCDKCAKGFYDILSGRGCTSCRCNILGSSSKTCHNLTGQCACKDGFTGLQCDQCAPYMYRFSPKKCTRCNCNVHGSKDLQCNEVGQCSCLPNAEGMFCDRCKENTYSIEEGCIACPSCYQFVQNEIQNLTKYLETIEQTIEGIENNLPLYIQDHKHFLNELRLLKAKIRKLKLEYSESAALEFSEKALNDLSKRAEDLHNEIVKLIQKFNDEFKYKNITDTLYIGRKNLKDAKNLVKTCEEALANATQMSSNLNRHNKTMTKLAEKALAATEEIESKTENFYQLSLNVTACCNETCNSAEAFRKAQLTRRDEIESIRSEVEKSSSGAQTIKSYLTGFHKETKNSRKEAIRLKKEASKLHIPDTNDMVNDLKGIEDNFSKINDNLQEFEQKLKDTQNQQNSAEQHLDEVKNKQNGMDRHFKLVLEYENRADEAINEINSIINSAQESLINLKQYEKIKQSAKEALNEMPEIRAKIDAILSNSEEIKNIFQELINTVEDIQRIKAKTNLLLELVEGNETMLLYNLKTLEELEEEQKRIPKNLEEYHRKLKRASTSLKDSKDFQNQLGLFILGIKELIKVLDAIPLTDYELSEVEKEVKTMEDMMDAVAYLTREKERLEKEVQNVKDILESIPINNATLCEAAKSEPKLIGS